VKKEGIERKVKAARKAMDKAPSVADAETYKLRVQAIINALKADVTGGNGRNILEEEVRMLEKAANVTHRTSHSHSTEFLDSIIQTGVSASYLDSPYSHQNFLNSALPYQMLELFQEFDKEKLFKLVEKKFNATEPAKVQAFKKSFERVVNARVKVGPSRATREDWTYWSIVVSNEIKEKFRLGPDGAYVSSNHEEAVGISLFVSDVFRIMHTLFPQDEVVTGYVDNDFLKAGGEYALPFAGTAKLDKEHEVVWRGRGDKLAGKRYRELPDYLSTAFPAKKLKLK